MSISETEPQSQNLDQIAPKINLDQVPIEHTVKPKRPKRFPPAVFDCAIPKIKPPRSNPNRD